MPDVHAAVIYLVTECVMSYHTENKTATTGKSPSICTRLHSLSLRGGHAELVLLANTTLHFCCQKSTVLRILF